MGLAAADEESSTFCAGILSSRAHLPGLLPPAPTTAPALFVHVQYPLLAKLLPFKSSSIVAMASIDFDVLMAVS